MAITQTGAIYKALTFDNTSSRNYGVYITGEAVYNAPQRDVEMISIPGRNGSLALDKGRFENIEVTYPAGIFADTEADFAQAVSDFRNFLCSKKGYCRLSDEYNPSEYRLAVYKSGLEVEPAQLRAGQFDITFECKPQRYLTSGEIATAVANNGTITNPTLFDAQPLLAVKGYGTIGFNGYEIELENGYIGNIQLFGERSNMTQDLPGSPFTLDCGTNDTYDTSLVQNGDAISLEARFSVRIRTSSSSVSWKSAAFTRDPSSTASETYQFQKGNIGQINITFPNVADNNLTAGSSNSKTCSVSVLLTDTQNHTNTVTISCSTTANNGKVYASITASESGYGDFLRGAVSMSAVTANSTVNRLGNPTYLDCETGEAYKVVNNDYISLNSFVAVGADLPVLAPGSNTVTYDNTVTELKITPRWWKI